MKTLIALFVVVCYGISQAQSIPDISGTWSGNVSFLNSHSQCEYTFNQSGLAIDGLVKIKSLNGRDSALAKLSGIISGQSVHIRTTEFVYRVGPFCLSRAELTYDSKGEQKTLRGRWRGELGLKTCPAYTTGKVEVAFVEKVSEEMVARTTETMTVAEDDQIGQLLMKELRSRAYYALIIGIDEYKDSKLASLDQPIGDATEFMRTLTTHYSFQEENIVLLKNPDRAKIIDAFDAMTNKVTEHDQLLIFYAGHGIWDEKLNQGYWLPSDAQHGSKSQWLLNGTICDYIGGIQSKHTLLITDACFSGGIFKERGASFNNSRAIIELYKMPSRKAMTSGTLTTVPDKSVFVKYLIKNLVENELPMISAGELFQKFKIAVINNSQNGQVPQYGAIGQAGDEGGEFIFLRR